MNRFWFVYSFAGLEKDVLILSKKTADSPFASFMGKGIINLAPQVVFDSIRNPQLRFTYDNMLKVGLCVCVCARERERERTFVLSVN